MRSYVLDEERNYFLDAFYKKTSFAQQIWFLKTVKKLKSLVFFLVLVKVHRNLSFKTWRTDATDLSRETWKIETS